MIKAKMKFRRPKLTIDQKALKKAIKPIAIDLKNQIKSDFPRDTGALQYSVDYRIYSVKGSAKAIIGVRSNYSRTVKGKLKIPNLYAKKQGAKEIIGRRITQATVARLFEDVKRIKGELLKGGK